MSKETSSHWIIKNIVGAVIFVLAFAMLANFILGIVTRHGKYIEVPDLTSMSVADAAHTASSHDLRVEVTDSVYVRRMARGAVFTQDPKAGSAVKSGRKIRLTINSMIPKKVSMPDLVGLSLRQARAELSSRGLYLGRITYVSDEATNIVLRQTYRNNEIRKGRSIESGATVDLVVGLNDSDYITVIPDVRGMKYTRAADVLQDNSLNVGHLKFDDSCKSYDDSLNAVVLSQTPSASSEAIQMGTEVSLSLSIDPAKLSKKK